MMSLKGPIGDRDQQPMTNRSPLAKATEWMTVELDLGDGVQTYTRDANVMPQWAGSSWYQLRYIDPTNSETLCAKENEAYWMGPRPDIHGPGDPIPMMLLPTTDKNQGWRLTRLRRPLPKARVMIIPAPTPHCRTGKHGSRFNSRESPPP